MKHGLETNSHSMTAPDPPVAPRVLLIDDDASTGRLIAAILRPERMEVLTAESAQAGFNAIARHRPDLLLLDLRLPDMSGLEVLEMLQQRHLQLPVIVLTATVDVKTAIRAMQLGAFHYLTKPLDGDELVTALRCALERRDRTDEVEDLRGRAEPAASLIEQMGPSAQVRKIIEQVIQVAPLDLTVLILGEPGTGKKLLAQTIHRQSLRRDHPLVVVDCGAIPELLLESELFGQEPSEVAGADRRRPGQLRLAKGGTLFLDEPAALSAALQPRFLRALELRDLGPAGGVLRRATDARILASANVGLQQQVRRGRFSEGLYQLLAQFTIQLPPLRERSEDIAHLVRRFVSEFCLELKRPIVAITPRALWRLEGHRWPGNVRELRSIVRQAVVRSTSMVVDEPLIDALLAGQREIPSANTDLAEVGGGSLRQIAERAAENAEIRAICMALRRMHGDKSTAAHYLQTDSKTLQARIRRYRIKPADYA